jgi:hypothetical protein
MAFSVGVELLNMASRARRKRQPPVNAAETER